jgi:hypothetical protein
MRTGDHLRARGFGGFIGFDHIRRTPSSVPAEQGVYAVVAPSEFVPEFVPIGTGGHFKGIDPNVSLARLSDNWVAGAHILYFGLARAGVNTRRGLRKRLSEYASFGEGQPVGHRGGRLIWQLRQSAELQVCWRIVREDPVSEEKALLREFYEEHGKLPFANLRF